MVKNTKTQFLPDDWMRQLRRDVSIRISGSSFCFQGRLDWVNKTVKEGRLVYAESPISLIRRTLSQKWRSQLPIDAVFTVTPDEPDPKWLVFLTGINYDAGTVEDLKMVRKDGKIFSVILAEESDKQVVPYDLKFTAGFQTHVQPMIFPREAQPIIISGRRPMVLEVAGMTGSVGTAFVEVVFRRRLRVVTQPETKLDSMGFLARAKRSPRRSVQNPARPEPPLGGTAFPSVRGVTLDPEYICSSQSREGLVNILMYEYPSHFQPGAGEELMRIAEFLAYGDGPGNLALAYWLIERYGDMIPSLESNIEPANVYLDPSVPYGAPIRIGIVNDGTWFALMKPGIAYTREGKPFETLMASGFDPSVLVATSVEHKLYPVDLNTKRIASVAPTGLRPAIAHLFQRKDLQSLAGYTLVPLGEFRDTIDGPALGICGQLLWYLYGQQLETMDPRSTEPMPRLTS